MELIGRKRKEEKEEVSKEQWKERRKKEMKEGRKDTKLL